MRNISIEIKMIISVILFTLLMVGMERYQVSENIIEQFVESKKSKNKLLIDTVSPVIALNLSLGLEDANKEYLDQIVKQNSDLIRFELMDSEDKSIYRYVKASSPELRKNPDNINFCSRSISDPITGEKFGMVKVYFDDHEYQRMLEKNKETTFKIFGISLVLLILFVFLIKREFKFLKKLSQSVLMYDPKLNNFTLTRTDRSDEVGIIHNAIISMVTRIDSHSKLLDDINQSLEQKISERTQELEEVNKQLKELSITDPLTQLFNRRHFENHLKEMWNLAKRKQVDISIIMCDIDHFKYVNDIYGHLVGDVVLKEVAQILKNALKRSSDFVARYGGEEFILVLYDTKVEAAEEVCITIQNNLKRVNGFEYKGVKTEPVSLSFGISSIIPDEMNQCESLVKLADSALYQAKESGRNRIVISKG